MNDYPKYLYKYQTIKNEKNLLENHSIQGILNNTAVFSKRKNFNDLFDSKIELISPSIDELLEIENVLKSFKDASPNGRFKSGGKIRPAMETFEILKKELIKIIDNYAFYCLSERYDSNLMWSHYSNSHRGFCIEFKTEFVKADKVTYKSRIPKIPLMDIFRLKTNPNQPDINIKIWKALRTKLHEWEYEKEYRFQASEVMLKDKISENEHYVIIQYSRNFINSIIFGCRMADTTKEFIKKKMGDSIKYNQAVEKLSHIEICPC